MKIPSISLIAAAALTMVTSACSKAVSTPEIVSQTPVFSKGDYDSKFYRIPALSVAGDGTIIALADKRIDNNADLPGRIDVVCRTSNDGGSTWTPYTDVAVHDDNGGYGDPALVIDRNSGDAICVATHGQGLWQATGVDGDHARIVTMRSSDSGKSWSAPVDITDQIFSNDSTGVKAQGITAFASSGRMLQTKDGRIMFVLVVRQPTVDDYVPLYAYVVYSDDGGKSWSAVPTPANTDADESKIAELPDGTLLMSIRNRHKGARKFSRSTDGGYTWSEAVITETLPEPACNGDMIAATNPDGKPVLYHTVPADPEERTNVTLSKSYDEGLTWQPVITLCPTGSCYSSITMLPDGSMGCLTEENAPDGGFNLIFSKIEL